MTSRRANALRLGAFDWAFGVAVVALIAVLVTAEESLLYQPITLARDRVTWLLTTALAILGLLILAMLARQARRARQSNVAGVTAAWRFTRRDFGSILGEVDGSRTRTDRGDIEWQLAASNGSTADLVAKFRREAERAGALACTTHWHTTVLRDDAALLHSWLELVMQMADVTTSPSTRGLVEFDQKPSTTIVVKRLVEASQETCEILARRGEAVS